MAAVVIFGDTNIIRPHICLCSQQLTVCNLPAITFVADDFVYIFGLGRLGTSFCHNRKA